VITIGNVIWRERLFRHPTRGTLTIHMNMAPDAGKWLSDGSHASIQRQ
jgi:hypothetical protein